MTTAPTEQLGFAFEAKPFLKWAGGKRQLLGEIRPLMPKRFGRYLEPFVGAGALFFDVAPDAAVHGPAYLADVNEELITSYTGVKCLVDDVLRLLREHEATHSKEYYLAVRKADGVYPDMAAARMIYLNKTCFNGLYRVNKKGKFNVPMGRYKKPLIVDETGLRAASAVLLRAQASLQVASFEKVLGIAERGDFVYFDPPYDPVSDTADFTGYSADGFGEEEQKKLAEIFQELTDDGVYCILSNADTPFIRKLYEDHPIREVSRSGAINSKASKRGRVGELLIRGWAW